MTGYRAPSFSIGHANPWAFECIERAGYRYSSSVYPIRHDHYGMPDAPRFAHDVREGLLEVPVTTMRLFGRNWPAGGGGYFRLMPYAMSRWLLRRVNHVDRQPAIFYFHPWEIDAGAAAGSRASTPRRAFATTSTWIEWSAGCASCCSISSGGAWTRCSSKPPDAAGGRAHARRRTGVRGS